MSQAASCPSSPKLDGSKVVKPCWSECRMEGKLLGAVKLLVECLRGSNAVNSLHLQVFEDPRVHGASSKPLILWSRSLTWSRNGAAVGIWPSNRAGGSWRAS